MLTIKSEKTSLLDLSINELRDVAWDYIDAKQFVDELKDPKLLTRLMYGKNKEIFSVIFDSENISFMLYAPNEFLAKMIDALKEKGEPFTLSSHIFSKRQFSLDFLNKYADNLNLYHAERQESIDVNFLDKYYDRLDISSFWEHFHKNSTTERIKEFVLFGDGKYKEDMTNFGAIKFLTADELNSIGLEVPEYYNNVMTEQRVMSGDPCSDGQRSFSIWLRKYRRVHNDPTGFPTWNQLLELYKKYPRMNNNGYIDWLYSRAVKNSDSYVQQFDNELSYSPSNITYSDYRDIAGDENSQEDFKIEFQLEEVE